MSWRHVAFRVGIAVATVAVVASAAFLLARLAPGDFADTVAGGTASQAVRDQQRALYGLDQPVLVHYGQWLGRAVRLDLGPSFLYGRPVTDLVVERAANTLALALGALALGVLLGVPLGNLTGSRVEPRLGIVVQTMSLAIVSISPLLLALALAVVGTRTGLFDVGGLLLPVLAVGLPLAATVERLQSTALADVMREPFIGAARARGIATWQLVWKHAWRPSVPRVLGVFAVLAAGILSGSFGVEVVTAWPGLGRLTFEALAARDVNLVAGCVAFGALLISVATLAADLVEPLVDPRLRERQSWR
jgi:ABC-type dipeptide/oligopeptide/nickel transport system permease component